MAPLTQLYFQKDFLRGPHPSPPPHACNFYINFKPLSRIKLFCGRERCVWGGGALGLSGSAGGLGSVVSSPGTPRAGGSSSQSLPDDEEDVPQSPPTTWTYQHLVVSRPEAPMPCPCTCIPRPFTARHTLPLPLGWPCVSPSTVGTRARWLHELSLCLVRVGKLSFFEK